MKISRGNYLIVLNEDQGLSISDKLPYKIIINPHKDNIVQPP